MEKYVASTPDSLILGLALRAVLDSIKIDEFMEIVAETGLDQVKDDEWYPTQKVLSMYKRMAELPNGWENLVSIGVKVYENAVLPPELNTIPSVLQTLNVIMELNMRNVPDERYLIEAIDDRHSKITDQTAFPHDLIYGFLYGIGRRFAPAGSSLVLKRTYMNPESPDKDGAIYELSW